MAYDRVTPERLALFLDRLVREFRRPGCLYLVGGTGRPQRESLHSAPRLGRARGMPRPVGSARRTVLATGLARSQTAIFQTAQGNDLFKIGDILRPAMRRDDLTDGVEGGHVLMAQHPCQIAGIDDPAGQQLHQG